MNVDVGELATEVARLWELRRQAIGGVTRASEEYAAADGAWLKAREELEKHIGFGSHNPSVRLG